MDDVESLLAELTSMAEYSYGERVNMLEHSLQTAAVARASGASDDLVLAALLHDIGHVRGDAGTWGLPSHAEVGASYLARLFPRSVTRPIRLHVDAKRFLVATDPGYRASLSEASRMSLIEQGGPLSPAEAESFQAQTGADEAIQLRRWDDESKVVGLEIDDLESYRSLIDRFAGSASGDMATHASWARDACRCNECRDASNDQHLIDVADLDGWSVESDSTEGETRIVMIRRGDERHRCVVPTEASEALTTRRWAGELAEQLQRDAVGPEDTVGTCRQLASVGLVLVRDVPIKSGAVLEFAGSIGFVRETNYGRLFQVEARPDPNNLAYTSVSLPLHTDNPYRDPCPSIQLLHCLAAAPTGGASQFADGFHAAEWLRETAPAAFDCLTSTALTFRFHDRNVDLQTKRPMIELDVDGAVQAVNVNHRSMEAPDPTRVDVSRFYAAYAMLAERLRANTIEITLQPGELVAFDNRRVLHGRSGFAVTEHRHLQGCYVDMDAVRSTARTNQSRL